ncbi:MAG: hypothetical protein NVS9B2_21140 [Steroidobacteraceae bacterium]
MASHCVSLGQNGQIGTTPKNISLTDPGACWTAAPECRTHIAKDDTNNYEVQAIRMRGLPEKIRYCPNTPYRKITRSIGETARDMLAVAKTRRSRWDRKKKWKCCLLT